MCVHYVENMSMITQCIFEYLLMLESSYLWCKLVDNHCVMIRMDILVVFNYHW